MRIEWSEDLSVGINEIDEQHQALFTRMNAFLAAIELGDAKEGVLSIYDFLSGYAGFHFETEENQMQLASFPGLAGHKAAHGEFTKNFQEVRSLYEAGKDAGAMSEILQTRLIDWWLRHVRTLDKEMGLYLQEQLKSQGL
jgi:hemerythrin